MPDLIPDSDLVEMGEGQFCDMTPPDGMGADEHLDMLDRTARGWLHDRCALARELIACREALRSLLKVCYGATTGGGLTLIGKANAVDRMRIARSLLPEVRDE